MNINAQELMLIRKNMKFGETKPTEQTSPVTEPISKPEATLKALEMQGHNNMTFQGVKANPTVLQKIRNLPKVVYISLSLAATPFIMNSCTNMEQSVTVDMSAILAAYQEQIAIQQEMLKELKLSNENKVLMNATLTAKLDELKAQLEACLISFEEFKQQHFAYMAQQLANDEIIIKHLESQGKTQDEIADTLANLDARIADIQTRLAKGEITFEQAVKELTGILNGIYATVQDILAEIKGMRSDMNNGFRQLDSRMTDATTVLKYIFLEQQNQTAKIDSIGIVQKGMSEDVKGLRASHEKLTAYILENAPKILEHLASIDQNSAEFKEYAETFKILGIDIRAILEKISVNTDTGMTNIEEAIKELNKTAVDNGKKMDKLTELVDIHFATANAQLAFIAKYLPELKDDPEIKAFVVKLIESVERNTEAVNNNTAITEEGIDNMTAGIKEIIAKLDDALKELKTVVSNTSKFGQYYMDQKENWATLFVHLNNGNSKLDSIIENQKLSQADFAAFKKDFANMKQSVRTIENYAYILTQQHDKILVSIDSLAQDKETVGGMTVEEYYNATLELDSINRTNQAEDIKNIINETCADKLITVNQWLESMDGRLSKAKDYTDSFNKMIALEQKIYAKIAEADFSNPDYTAILNEIRDLMKEYEHVCNCMQNNQDPGTEEIPNPDDLENRFN